MTLRLEKRSNGIIFIKNSDGLILYVIDESFGLSINNNNLLLYGNGKLLFETLWSNIKDSTGSTLGANITDVITAISDTYVFNINQSAITNYVVKNAAITGATKTKITYDAKGLVISGADATTADIAASTNKNYVTDAQQAILASIPGTLGDLYYMGGSSVLVKIPKGTDGQTLKMVSGLPAWATI